MFGVRGIAATTPHPHARTIDGAQQAGDPGGDRKPMSVNTEAWFGAVVAERERQDAKWAGGPGDCSHPSTPDRQRLAVLVEEVGEVAKAILDDELGEIRAEVTQVMSVCAAWLEGLDQERRVR